MNTANELEVSRISKIFELLVTEGFRPEMASETSVRVKYEGSTFHVDIDEKDKSFYSIVCAYIWEIESEQEILTAYKAASNTGMNMKVAKAFVTRDEKNVWVVMEQFFPEVEQFLPTVVRGLDLVANARRNFCEDMRKLITNDEAVTVAPSAPALLLN